MSCQSPPRFARWVVRHALPSGPVRESIVGDLDDEHHARARHDPRAANRWFRQQAVSVAARAWRDRLTGRRWGGRQRGGFPGHGGLIRDVRHGVRLIRREPGFAATVILTVGLAVGANVAVFSVLESVLLRSLPYPFSDELVEIHRQVGAVSYPDFADWVGQETTLDGFAAYQLTRETFVTDAFAEEWIGVEATGDLFRVLGVEPAVGSGFPPGEHLGNDAIVLGYSLWRSRFGGDPDVIGASIAFEDRTVTVIGVMPRAFYFPTPREQFWATLSDNGFLDHRGAWFLRTIARLAPGVTPEDAQREIAGLAARIDEFHDVDEEGGGIRVVTRQEAYVGDTRPLMMLLIGAVTLVLAVACANLGSLSLTRAVSRWREFAVRAALGAGRAQLARQVLVENLLLAVIGGILGIVLASLLVNVFVALSPPALPRRAEIGLHPPVLAYALVVIVGSGLIVGSAPAWWGRKTDTSSSLRAHAGTGARRHHRLLGLLLIGQLALTSILLVGAGLLLNSFRQLVSVRPGFDVGHTLSLSIDLPRGTYDHPPLVRQYHEALHERLTALPGVTAAGFSTGLPFTSSYISAAYRVEREDTLAAREVYVEVVSDDYLTALGLPITRGRGFVTADGPDQPLVAIINQHMADHHWPDQDPIGRRFTWEPDAPKWITVVGVVPDVLRGGLDDTAAPMAYLSLRQFHGHYDFLSARHGFVAVRTAGDPSALIDAAVQSVRSLDPGVPVSDIRTTQELVAGSVAQPRFRTVLFSMFGILALAISVVGIYGVVAFAVAQRRREFGIRMALGAARRRIIREVMVRGAWLIGVGLVLGLAGAAATTHLMAAMLFGVTPTDPWTFALVLLLMSGVGLCACAFPARRASRVDPVVILKEQ